MGHDAMKYCSLKISIEEILNYIRHRSLESVGFS